MTAKKRLVIGFLLLAAVMLGCFGKGKEEAALSVEKEKQTFVDAHGEEHTMEIDPEINENPYDPEAFQINGDRMAYTDQEKYGYRLGVDVSFYQGQIDWEKVRADGCEFAIIRLGFRGYGKEGNLHVDEQYEQNFRGAKAAGLDVGVYFFAQAVNEEEAKEEARFVLKHLKGQKLDLPVVYDPEHIVGEESRTQDVTGKQFTRNAKVFCEEIEKAGYQAMIYSNMLWEAFEFDLKELKAYPIWYADYEAKPQTPYHFQIWQYTEKGQVDGIQGNVDLNIELKKK